VGRFRKLIIWLPSGQRGQGMLLAMRLADEEVAAAPSV
jgi:hypothetical protein